VSAIRQPAKGTGNLAACSCGTCQDAHLYGQASVTDHGASLGVIPDFSSWPGRFFFLYTRPVFLKNSSIIPIRMMTVMEGDELMPKGWLNGSGAKSRCRGEAGRWAVAAGRSDAVLGPRCHALSRLTYILNLRYITGPQFELYLKSMEKP
jgi:hypothetical protein